MKAGPAAPRGHRIVAGLVAALAVGCQARSTSVLSETPDAVRQRLAEQGHAVGASLGGGRVVYLGFEAFPVGALPGDEVTVVHYWVANESLGQRYRVFVHALLEGAHGWIGHGDHDPTPPTDAWPVGRVVRDEHRIELPVQLPGRSVGLRVGLYRGDRRLPVDDAAHDDGSGRIRAGQFEVSGSGLERPTYRAPQLAVAPTIDGKLDDEVWSTAPWIEGFVPSRGSGRPRVRTRVRMAWQPEILFVAFEAEDPDILASLAQRDDPVYREEAVEIFIDPGAPDGSPSGSYAELQVNPLGARFDAAFSGGARSNMRTSFDADYEAAVQLDGTVSPPSAASDPPDADRGWTSEWAIRVRSLPGVDQPLAPGRRWRVNLFRVAKDRRAGRLEADESAWSPPLMGDFHNLERFGELWFVSAEALDKGNLPSP